MQRLANRIRAALGFAGKLADIGVDQGRKPPQHGCSNQQSADQAAVFALGTRQEQEGADTECHTAGRARRPAGELTALGLRNRFAEYILGGDRAEASREAEDHDQPQDGPAGLLTPQRKCDYAEACYREALQDAACHPDPLADGELPYETSNEELRNQAAGLANRHQEAENGRGCADHCR